MHNQPQFRQSPSETTAQRAVAELQPEGQSLGEPGEFATRLQLSPRAVAQRVLNEQIHSSPYMRQQKSLVAGIAAAQRVSNDTAPSENNVAPVPLQRRDATLPSANPNNTGLPDNLKSGIESLSGISMDGVKVHYNSPQPAQLNALAYAQGTDIHVAPGQEQHLPHEAWHVVQQAQGRVQPTMQMKAGVSVNDDRGLEHEADVMGARALGIGAVAALIRTGAGSPIAEAAVLVQRIGRSQVVQAAFVPLTEERIKTIQDEATKNEENVDAEYLQGLWERKASQNENTLNPTLYFRLGKIGKNHFTGDQDDINAKVELFAHEDAVSESERRAEEGVEGGNLLQVIAKEVNIWAKDESGPVTASSIAANVKKSVGNYLSEQKLNDLVGSIMTGGEPAEEATGGYGAIEFRFHAAGGKYYIDEEFADAKSGIEEKYPGLEVVPSSSERMENYSTAYRRANLPFANERASLSGVFVDEASFEKFVAAIWKLREESLYGDVMEAFDVSKKIEVKDPNNSGGLPAAPLAVPKVREKIYDRSAPRGGRGAGQKAAMGNFSARDYVARFNQAAANEISWEWLHVQGSRLGGPNRPENLVAGTAEANTAMIPYERGIFALSQVATYEHPVKVVWTATARTDESGRNTHIGNSIKMEVSFTNGTPDKTDHIDPVEIKSAFPAEVNAVEGAHFTKLDRDVIEAGMAPPD
jgi:Domain of unknown function (DUF4157)